jgi:hypothetical protein
MIKALFGPSTVPHTLRGGLDASMTAHKEIARRVAAGLEASTQNPGDAQGGTAAAGEKPDLVQDMAALADTELRYETEARLLHLAYQGLRTAIRGNGGAA